MPRDSDKQDEEDGAGRNIDGSVKGGWIGVMMGLLMMIGLLY